MKILIIISGLDFPNHTRRSTITAIHSINPDTEVLLFNSIRNYFRPKKTEPFIKFHNHHFWVPEKLRRMKFPGAIEHFIRKRKWNFFFRRYDYLMFIDPNQYYLLQYVDESNKVIYLLRDPVVLQNDSNQIPERLIIKRSNAILAVSQTLKDLYIRKHHGIQPEKVYYWSNSVDLELWDYKKFSKRSDSRVIAGMAGNINNRTDLALLEYLLMKWPEVNFEVAGRLNLSREGLKKWENLLAHRNFHYLGYIPFCDLPAVVSGWNIGLLLESCNNEYSIYFNQNKIYQYLAMGKPFVSYEYNEGFHKFRDVGFLGKTGIEYSNCLFLALQKAQLPDTFYKCLAYAEENSTMKRATEFLEILDTI